MTTIANTLALARFGGFHGGGGFGLFLVGLLLIGALVWALNGKNNSTT